MKTVKVYIETTVTGPFVRDGKYGAALVFIKQNGEGSYRAKKQRQHITVVYY